MLPRILRVRLTLEKSAEADQVLAAMEETLGRRVTVRQRLKTVPILSVELTGPELERVRAIPGIRKAEEEGSVSIPPKPMKRRESR
jgi:hypothetical protein